jgi:predicted dehydrogenase
MLVLGCGSIGRRHIANLGALEVGDVRVFDVDRARARAAGMTVVDDLDAAWAWPPQAVIIATPTASHVELALAAVEHGCHVFIEKPLSHQLAGVRELEHAAARRGVTTLVGCNMRFHFGPATMKRLLDAGAIGDVLAARLQTGSYLPNWHPATNYHRGYSADPDSGGAVLDCIHELDLALWYLGPATLAGACAAPARSLGLETDGVCELVLRHECGAISGVHLNFIQRDYRRTCQLIGTEGTLYWDEEDGRVLRYGPAGQLAEQFAPPHDWGLNQMYIIELAHFLRAAGGVEPSCNPITAAIAPLEIALAARRSGWRASA